MFTRIASCSICLFAVLAIGACGTTATPRVDSTSESQPSTLPGSDNTSGGEILSPDNYKLGQGDKIAIQVFDEPDLTMDATVSTSGVINYSYLGDVQVSGKTPSELERHIVELLRNGFLVNPSVNVSVTEYRPFFIGGEVRSPGSYPYRPGLTLDQAIAIAGGLTDRASQRQMFINKAGSAAGSQQRSSLSDPVGPGDTVTINEGFF